MKMTITNFFSLNNMLDMVNSIPENLGWALVGAIAMLDAILVVMLAKCIIIAIKERIEIAREDARATAEEIEE